MIFRQLESSGEGGVALGLVSALQRWSDSLESKTSTLRYLLCFVLLIYCVVVVLPCVFVVFSQSESLDPEEIDSISAQPGWRVRRN